MTSHLDTATAEGRMKAELADTRLALARCVDAWERWYQQLPEAAEADEFGAFQCARNLLSN